MASNPNKIQQRGLKDEFLTESTLRTWLEIGGKKQEARYVEKHPRSEQKEQGIKIIWESGFECTFVSSEVCTTYCYS